MLILAEVQFSPNLSEFGEQRCIKPSLKKGPQKATNSNYLKTDRVNLAAQDWKVDCDRIESMVGQKMRRCVLCISTSEQVFRTRFAGQIDFFDAKTTFSITNGTK